ncbi:hypothetical protein HPG69_005928 [Diceros bicornis minor]|uniref:Uncharacterized protein n=1 Tax=Diceros bicornis minor TaxID=77932 RepID=A0A7J7ET43_DICBM|nr:hypothetical protein HPG69_005928 [Diceros bicornis minor]
MAALVCSPAQQRLSSVHVLEKLRSCRPGQDPRREPSEGRGWVELCLGVTEPCFVFPALLCPKAPSRSESSLKTVLPCMDAGSSCSWLLAAPTVNRQAGCRGPSVHAACSGRLLPTRRQVLWTSVWRGARGTVPEVPPRPAVGHTEFCLTQRPSHLGEPSRAQFVASLGPGCPDSRQPLAHATGPTQHPNEQDGAVGTRSLPGTHSASNRA